MKALLAAAVLTVGIGSPAWAQRAPTTSRDNLNPRVWSSDRAAFASLLATGYLADEGIKKLVAHSGWSVVELREGLQKSYPVEPQEAQRFLDSEAGRLWLANQSLNLRPFSVTAPVAAEALRSAILRDAADGAISGAGILAGLPQANQLLAYAEANPLPANVCAVARCMDPEQCGSTLSWLMFLPACLQANSAF